VRVDARILAATNATLEHMIASGQFRADLFYRLAESSPRRLSIIIPLYNERDAVSQLHARLLPVIRKLSASWQVQLILIDDGSTDETYGLLREFFGHIPEAQVSILQHAVNRDPLRDRLRLHLCPGRNPRNAGDVPGDQRRYPDRLALSSGPGPGRNVGAVFSSARRAVGSMPA
jgi:glycosyltransferase involved in cell wall biosynthesis